MYEEYNIEIGFDGHKVDGKHTQFSWGIRKRDLGIAIFRNVSCIGSNANGVTIKGVEGALEDMFDEIRDIVLNDAREIYEKHKMADKI